MKRGFKSLLPLFALLLMVILIPQVFSADVNSADDLTGELDNPAESISVDSDEIMSQDSADVELASDDAIYVSTTGDDKNNGSQSAPFATIYRAVNVAMDTGATNIYVTEGYYRENSIPVECSVNIIGFGNVTIDAEQKDRIFKIEGEYEVELSGMTLINGYAPTDAYSEDIHEVVYYAGGGAVNIVEAYVKMSNMTFINNYAEDFGGAVNVEAKYCSIRNSKFISNYAGVFGGAIDFEDDNGTVDNCTFIANEATNGAGIGYIASAGTIINSYFENNTAEDGAAIFIENGDLTFDSSNANLIENNKFIHNEATQQGGAIEVENQQMSSNADWTLIRNNEFIDNYAYNGGAISAYYGDSGIQNNVFINNSAGYGGAIASISTTDSTYIVIGGIYLKNNTIINCTAEENGNGIFSMGRIGTPLNITFSDNGTVYCPDGKAVILNVTVCDDVGNPISGTGVDFTVNGKATINPASDLVEGFGTVRYVPRENGTFEISGIYGNRNYMEDIYNVKTATLVVENAIEDYFGVIYVSDGEGDDDNTGSKDSPVKTFNQAYLLATRDGGSFNIVVNKGNYYVPSYTIEKGFNVTGIDNPVLDGKNQGTIFALYGGPDEEFHITGLTFINGVADPSKYAGMNEGGAIFFKGGKLFLENDTFMYNSANDYGGAVHINKGMDSWGTMYRAFGYIKNCTFKNNLVKYFGGGLSLYDCDVVVEDSYFEANTAKKGGAISILSGLGNLTVKNSVFVKNTASEEGGAIEAGALNTYNVRYFADISNSTFISNSAANGGAIIGGDANIVSCKFINNTATEFGGAVLINETFLGESITNQSVIKYSIFENNDAKTGKAYYGTAVLISDNFWANNLNSIDELKNNNVISLVEDTSNISWVNLKISPVDNGVTLTFVSSNASQLDSLPDYSVRVFGNDLNEDVLISNNSGSLALDTSKTPSISVSTGGSDTIVSGNTYKKSSTLTVTGLSYAVNAKSRVITVTLKDADGNAISSEITVTINGKQYTPTTNVNGIAKVTSAIKTAGSYKVNVNFAGDDSYNPATKSATLKVNKVKTKLTVAKTAKSKKLTVTLKTSAGKAISKKKVTVKLNGKKYTAKTNSKGKATVSLKVTAKKTYKVTVKFAGDKTYKGITKKASVKVR